MKARAASPDVLVDLNRLDELREISVSGGTLRIGAMATYTQVMASSEVDVSRPILAEVAAQIADVQVRNRGTIGGNVCSNDPTNHLPPLLVALGASFEIRGAGGERTVSADEFFLGVYMTAVGEGDLLTAIAVPAAPRLPTASPRSRSAATGRASRTRPRASTEAQTAGRARLRRRGAGRCCKPAGSEEESVRKAVADAALDPPSDVHASADYRRHLAGGLRRARRRRRPSEKGA